jgi:hypothetical protein
MSFLKTDHAFLKITESKKMNSENEILRETRRRPTKGEQEDIKNKIKQLLASELNLRCIDIDKR